MKFECINAMCSHMELLKGSSPNTRFKVSKVGGMWHLGIFYYH